MPRSAIQAGVVDSQAGPSALPARIAGYLGHLYPTAQALDRTLDAEALESIVGTLRALTGHDFASYKKSTVQRRIERRMAVHRQSVAADYVVFLHDNAIEAQLLFKELLIGVTCFFRDPDAWDQLKHELVPELLAKHPDGGTLRVWVPACSTGEEVYSLAIVMTEAIEALRPARHLILKIFATDIDTDAIDRARVARYPANIADDVSAERLERFFVQIDSGYMVRRELREKAVFALQNVAMDPPFTKLDMLACRNLLIYFEPALQRKLFPLFHYSLEPGGLLMLGNAETVGASTEHFAPVPGKSRFFRKVDSFRSAGFVAFPATFDRPVKPSGAGARDAVEPSNSALNLQAMADHVLLQRYAPAAVLVTSDGDVLYINGRTGKYLEPAAGKANWNVFAMAREGLGQAISTAFREAVQRNKIVAAQALVIDADRRREVRVTIDPMSSPKQMAGMVMIVFTEIEPQTSGKSHEPSADTSSSGDDLRRQLDLTLDALRAARNDAQSAEDQSRAANEELQSANEELQSTNEELTTSKEEMQSMNEELQTVNQELQAKLNELTQASDDMRNLLNSTDIATLFLDEALRVRRFTLQIGSLFKLIPTDMGRPITDISNELEDWAVADDARAVLGNLVYREREVAASGDRWFKGKRGLKAHLTPADARVR